MVQTNDLLQQNHKHQRRDRLQDGLYMALRVVPSGSDHRRSNLLNRLMHSLGAVDANVEDTPRQSTQLNRNGESGSGTGIVRGGAGGTGDMTSQPVEQWRSPWKLHQCIER